MSFVPFVCAGDVHGKVKSGEVSGPAALRGEPFGSTAHGRRG